MDGRDETAASPDAGNGRRRHGSERRVGRGGVPEATVGRLSVYLRTLVGLAAAGRTTVSSDELADGAGVTSAKVRKDLSWLGSFGTRGVGYDVAQLIHRIRRELGLTQEWGILIAGIGNLGHALANYRGFGERGFRVVALVDADPGKVGERVAGIEVRPVEELAALVRERGATIGVVATPADAAQEVVDRMVASGIRSILNFAPAVVSVPDGVRLRKVDLAIELQILAYYEQRGTAGAPVRAPAARVSAASTPDEAPPSAATSRS
ncbi:MAG: redox-sensing transcriptional repressor Rex [Actinomycetota bacterium]|nr:MAG: redox-sensing transcriptional repressor Rex [Actinomycetota bacterium]